MPLRTAMFHFTSYIGRNSDKKQIVRREVQLYLVAPKSLLFCRIGMLLGLAACATSYIRSGDRKKTSELRSSVQV